MTRLTAEVLEEIVDAIGPGLQPTLRAAEVLGLSCRTLEEYRLRGRGPRFVRISSRAVRYRPRELARWVAEREVASTSDPGRGTGAGPAAS